MMVEIRIPDTNTLPEAMAGIRQWLDHRRFQPAVFRYTFKEAGLLLGIEFASAAEANEFAQAFDGTIAEAQAPFRRATPGTRSEPRILLPCFSFTRIRRKDDGEHGTEAQSR
jgi:hypothetical protein